jgi:uncharacterized protein YndB with AHSA1/START domain
LRLSSITTLDKELPMPDIMHLMKINAQPKRVYEAIATADGIRNWWTRDAVLDAKTGGAGEFGFYGHRFVINLNVKELKPPSRLSWNLMSGGFEDTTITFDLRGEGETTTLSFVHAGFDRADDRYAGATSRWGYYLVSLKKYLETGSGNPNPDDIDF